MMIKVQDMLDKQGNHLLDFIKGCGCIGVVWMHIMFPGLVGTIIHKISQYAVPVFLMISGYYAYGDGERAYPIIIRRCKRIGKIAMYAIFIYLVCNVVIHIEKHDFVIWIQNFYSIKLWIKIILLSDFDIIGAGHLWFLPAQAISYLILLYIDKKNIYSLAYKFIPLLFAIRIVTSIITLSLGMSWHLRENFLVDSLPWMLLGNYLGYNSSIKDKYNNKFLFFIFASSGIWAILAVTLFSLGYVSVELSEVGILGYSSVLFVIAIKNPTISICRHIEKLGKDYSLYVYIIHIMISSVINVLAKKIGVVYYYTYTWVRPIIVACCSIVVSKVINMVFIEIKKRNQGSMN